MFAYGDDYGPVAKDNSWIDVSNYVLKIPEETENWIIIIIDVTSN